MASKVIKKNINKTKKPLDFTLCITVLLLLSLGIIMVLSVSAPSSLSTTGNSYTYVIRQTIFGIVGVVAMLFISKIDYRIYKRFYKIIYILSVGCLLLVAIPGIGVTVKGASRWIDLGFGRFQPSELSKVGLIVFYAAYLSDHKNELGSFKNGILKPLIFAVPVILILFFIQDHLSAIIVIASIISIMMLMAGSKLKHFLVAGTTIGSLAVAGMTILAQMGKGSFRIARITTFLNPWADAQGDGWQVIQSLYAIGSGGLFGVGLGESKQKYLYIPEPHNDFIFAVIAEELGFVGCLVIILLFAIFIYRGILTAMKSQDSFGSLLAIGITSLIGIQAIINIAVVTSSMPATGMSLPFFSYGGTALLILLCSVGILLNISRSTSKV